MTLWPQLDIAGRRVGYARVSTPDQKLDMQLDGLSAVGCDPIFRDHGVSGGKAKRPGLDKALRSLKRGDALVVFKLDRLGRSALHLADLLARFEREGIHFCSVSEGINTTTPGGKLVYHVFGAVAEFERDIIRENTINGLRAARDRGKRLGRPFALDEASALEAHRRVLQGRGTIEGTAALFGVSESTLRRAFKRFDLISANVGR